MALAIAGLLFAAARGLPANLGAMALGAAVGAWCGIWAARPLDGRADLRWLLPAAGIALGLAAARLPPSWTLVATVAASVTALALRSGLRRWHSRYEWDDPAVTATLLTVLAAIAGPFALLATRVLPTASGSDWMTLWPAVSLGAVVAAACATTLGASEERDPFADDPRRITVVLLGATVLGGAALALWAPRFAPLLVVALLALAAGGRARTLAVLGAAIAVAAAALADLRPLLLGAMFGGWSGTASLALVAVVLALASTGSLLVHQRDRVRARLRAASGHLLTLAEKSPGLVATFDRERRHRFFNDAYRAWSGLPADRLQGAPMTDVLGEPVVSRLDSSIARAMAGASQQLQVETAQGRSLDVRLEPYFGLDGGIAGVHVLAEDVSWRGQSERDLKALVAASPEPTLVLDESGQIQLHNEAAAALFAATSRELVGTPLTAWLSEATGRQAREGADAGLRARRSDGSVFPVELRLGSMPGEHGGRAVVALRDLSRQRALEEAARHAREQAQATLDSISDALVVVDRDGTITGFNPAATELTGWPAADAVGRVLEEVVRLVDPGQGAMRPSIVRDVLRTGRPGRADGEIELVRRDGAQRAIEESASPLRDRTGQSIGGVLMFHDVAHVREQAQALSHMAQHDFLTGLPNRVLFQDRLTQALATVAQGGKGAVLYIDLDKFKPINDTLGHPVGDKVLQEVSTRLRACVREDDTVSRQGGDEFVLLLQRLADPRDAARVAEKLIRSVEQPILVDGHELRVGASVGISLFPQDGRDARTLMKQADTALYHVKETGRGRYSYFTDLMGERAEARIRMEHDLRFALMNEDFVLDYQPIVDVATGRFTSVEALLRWRRGDGSVLLPQDFLSVAEETGLIVQIDEWVLREACRQNAAWQARELPRWPISVNVSLARFDPARLLGQVRESLASAALDAACLEIEFRGDQLIPLGDKGRALVAELRAVGAKVAIDDVASTDASVASLADLGLDALKLDLSVVGALPDDARARRVAEGVCRLGRALGYPVIAKGVESEAHRELLVGWGCVGLQGALFAPPMSAELLPALVDVPRPMPEARRA
ncbi:sensor domain-containing protein [Lysobacter humi (ex Lee et al. 2017)]